MKLTYLSLIIIICSSNLFAQKLTPEDFLGNWTVVDSKLLPGFHGELDDDGKQKMEAVRKGFINTIFSFSANHNFKINFPVTIPDFMKELEFVNNKRWKIEDGRMIAVGSEDDGYSLMGIFVGKKENKTFFILDETPFMLEVTKN